jgi:hypothetical protein
MSRRRLPAVLLLVVALAGCAGGAEYACNFGPQNCEEVLGQCEPEPADCGRLPSGASSAPVTIDSAPTSAAIFIDGRYVGQTPLRYRIHFSSNTRFIHVVAEPVYPSQTRQERRLQVPPLPQRIQFFMTNPGRDQGEARPAGQTGTEG